MTPEQILELGMWTVAILAFLLGIAKVKLDRETVWRRCRDCKQFFRGNVKLPFLPTDSDGTFHLDECLDCQRIRKFYRGRDREIEETFRK